MKSLDEYILGETSEQRDFDTRNENRDVASAMASQAQGSIRIFTHSLESPVYNDRHFILHVKNLATRSKNTHINILVKNSASAIKSGHRIIELARQLSSSIHLHIPPREFQEYPGAFMLADDSGFIYKNHGETFKGYYNFNDKLKVRDLEKVFMEAWERSMPDPEMRRLYI